MSTIDPKFRYSKKFRVAGLWTDVCLAFPVISAPKAGYEVYFVADASGANSVAAHELAIQRMIQGGAVPLGAAAYTSELVRDWGRADMARRRVLRADAQRPHSL